MKVFEVIMEHVRDDGSIQLETQYVTSEANTLKAVSDHFTVHCFEYEKDLKSVREVLVITEHL